MRIRCFRPNDRAACLAVFDGNTPEYFHVSERPAFAECLDRGDYRPPRLRGDGAPTGRFYVVEEDDEILGCGGWYLDGETAVLSWGMVARSIHRQGIGRFLLRERLKVIRLEPRAKRVCVRTTASVRGFFEREGFRLEAQNVPGLVDEMPLVELSLMLPKRPEPRRSRSPEASESDGREVSSIVEHDCWWTARRRTQLTDDGLRLLGCGVPMSVLFYAAAVMGRSLSAQLSESDDEGREIRIDDIATGSIHDDCFFHLAPVTPLLKEAVLDAVLAAHSHYLKRDVDWSSARRLLLELWPAGVELDLRSFPAKNHVRLHRAKVDANSSSSRLTGPPLIDCAGGLAIVR